MVLLDFLVIIFIIGISVTFVRSRLNKRSEDRRLARAELTQALESNSRHALENMLILNDRFLDKDAKKAIKFRVAELSIEEDNLTYDEQPLRKRM